MSHFLRCKRFTEGKLESNFLGLIESVSKTGSILIKTHCTICHTILLHEPEKLKPAYLCHTPCTAGLSWQDGWSKSGNLHSARGHCSSPLQRYSGSEALCILRPGRGEGKFMIHAMTINHQKGNVEEMKTDIIGLRKMKKYHDKTTQPPV
mgnify:CR=1 FL=1